MGAKAEKTRKPGKGRDKAEGRAQERAQSKAQGSAESAHRAVNRPFFLGRGNLRRRGWTESGILRFLGEPDAHAPNPVVPSAARMRLYDEERVARIEASEGWREWRAQSEHRREANRVRAEERAMRRAEQLAKIGVYAEVASHVANR